MPGVNVTTAVRVGAAGLPVPASAAMFVVGLTERGPTEPTKIGGVADFERHFGKFVNWGTLHQATQVFFEEGGTVLYVKRMVGASATSGFLELEAGGDVVATVTAANPGAWSADVEVAVIAGTAFGTVRGVVYHDGEVVYTTRSVSTLDAFVAAMASDRVSHLVTVTKEVGAADLPDEVAATALSAGNDQRGSVDHVDHLDAFAEFGVEYGTGVLALPGVAGTVAITDPGDIEAHGETVFEGLANAAAATRRVAFASFAGTVTDIAEAASVVEALGELPNMTHLAVFWPSLNIPDGSGGLREVTPEALAAATRARAQTLTGPWRPGAGDIGEARFAVSATAKPTKAQSDAADEGRLNVVRTFGTRVRVYGARSASADEVNWKNYTLRDTVNVIVTRLEGELEQYVFQPIDARGVLFSLIEAKCKALLDPMRVAGGLYELTDPDTGARRDPGYSARCDATNNSTSSIADGVVNVEVGVRVSQNADLIRVTLFKSNLTTQV